MLTAGEALREIVPGAGTGQGLPRAGGISSSLPLPPPLPALPAGDAAAPPCCCCASFFCSKYLRFTSFISRCSRSISYLYSCTWRGRRKGAEVVGRGHAFHHMMCGGAADEDEG